VLLVYGIRNNRLDLDIKENPIPTRINPDKESYYIY